MKLFNGSNNTALSYHVSTRYEMLSIPPFQNILDPALCNVATYLPSVLTHVSKKTCFQRGFEFLKIIYREKCGTVTERNQNIRLVNKI